MNGHWRGDNMEPIISPWIIYIMHVASVLWGLSLAGAISGGFFLFTCFIGILDEMPKIKEWEKSIKIISIVSILGLILIPTKEDMLAMLALSYVTPDNIQLVQGNVVDFITKIVDACRR